MATMVNVSVTADPCETVFCAMAAGANIVSIAATANNVRTRRMVPFSFVCARILIASKAPQEGMNYQSILSQPV